MLISKTITWPGGPASELVPRGHGRGPHSAADAAAGVFIVHFFFYLGVRISLVKRGPEEPISTCVQNGVLFIWSHYCLLN